MKKFNITFTETRRYNPMTRTVLVEANNQTSAINVFAREFDSLKFHKDMMIYLPSGKKVTIDKVEEFVGEKEVQEG